MGSHRAVVILSVLSLILGAGLVTFAALYFVQMYIADDSCTKEADIAITNLTIRDRFPGYFRTPEEQAALEKAYGPIFVKVANVSAIRTRCFVDNHCEKTTVTPANATTTIKTTPARRRRETTNSNCTLDNLPETDLTYNGCCITYQETIVPNTLPTPGVNSVDVKIVQIPNNYQYFSIQQCCQANSCYGCQCTQVYYVASAVIVKPTGDYGVSRVLVPGCCQCLNYESEDD